MKEDLCYGCIGQHKLKVYPKKSKITTNIRLNPMQESEGSEDDLLEDVPLDHSHQILMMTITKKVPNILDVVLSSGA